MTTGLDENVEIVSCVMPELQTNKPRVWVNKIGSENTNYQAMSATTWDNSRILLDLNNQGTNMLLDRQMWVKVPMRFTFTGTNTDPSARLVQVGTDSAPRCSPVMRALSLIKVTLNNDTINVQPATYIDALQRVNMTEKRLNGSLSTSCWYPDQYQRYQDWATGPDNMMARGGSSRNPLGSYGESFETLRGGFPYTNTTDAPGVTTCYYDYEFCEPLFGGVFSWNSDLCAIDNFNTAKIELLINSDFTSGACWSAANRTGAPQQITTVTCTLRNDGAGAGLGIPTFLFKNYRCPVFIDRPVSQNLPFTDIDCFTTPALQLTAANYAASPPVFQTTEVTTNNITMNSIPSRIMIYLRRQDSERTFKTTDSFMRINTITLQYDGGIYMSTCDPRQLHQISVRNGLQMSWEQWYNTVGSIVILDLARDVALSGQPFAAISMGGNIPLQVKINYSNINSTDTITPTAFVLVMNEGIISIDRQNAQHKHFPATAEAIARAGYKPQMIDYVNPSKTMLGGTIAGDIQAAFSNIPKYAKRLGRTIYDNRRQIGNAALDVAKVAGPLIIRKMLGAGERERCEQDEADGAGLEEGLERVDEERSDDGSEDKHVHFEPMSGGRVLTTSQLMRHTQKTAGRLDRGEESRGAGFPQTQPKTREEAPQSVQDRSGRMSEEARAKLAALHGYGYTAPDSDDDAPAVERGAGRPRKAGRAMVSKGSRRSGRGSSDSDI